MADYKVIKVDEVDNRADLPVETRMMREIIDSDQIAITYRRFPAGYKPAHGHTHSKIDEVIYIISGQLKIKLDDDVIEVGPKTVVKITPHVKRGYHNDGSEDVQLIVVSVQGDMVSDNGGVPDREWWTA